MFYALVPNPKLDIQTTHAAEKNIVMFYAYLVPNPKLDIQTIHAAEKNIVMFYAYLVPNKA